MKLSLSRLSEYSFFKLILTEIREWTDKYANQAAVEKAKIQKLTEMGFTDQQARAALEGVAWDEEAAINKLLGA